MKKKIITTLLMIAFFVIIIVLIGIIKNSSSKKDNDSGIHSVTITDEFRYYPENDYNYPVGEYLEWDSNDQSEFVIEANIEKGSLIFSVYDMNGAGFKELEKYTLCEEYIIDSSGEFVFKFENLEDGKWYCFRLAPEDNNLEKQERYVVANGKFIRRFKKQV